MSKETYHEIKRISGEEMSELLSYLDNVFDLGTGTLLEDNLYGVIDWLLKNNYFYGLFLTFFIFIYAKFEESWVLYESLFGYLRRFYPKHWYHYDSSYIYFFYKGIYYGL